MVAQLVRAPPCHGGGRGFESLSLRRKYMKYTKYFSIQTVLLSIATLLAIAFLRFNSFLLYTSLLFIIIIFFYFSNRKIADLKIFIFGFIFGPLAESFSIHFGAWEYNLNDISVFNFPFYLPLVWGIACMVISHLYTRFLK